MLSSFAVDKENQLAHGQRGGSASKHRKALGDAGFVSKNGAAKMAKSTILQDSRSKPNVTPLGSRQTPVLKKPLKPGENGGTEAVPRQPRKTLGDISNRGEGSDTARAGSSKGLGLKDGSSGHGPKLSAGGLSLKDGALANSSQRKAPLSSSSSSSRVPLSTPVPRVRPNEASGKAAAESSKSEASKVDDVPDVEMPMGRLGDEEELLVQRRDERRFVAAMAESFRVSKPNRPVVDGKREVRGSRRTPRPGHSRRAALKTGVGSLGSRQGRPLGEKIQRGASTSRASTPTPSAPAASAPAPLASAPAPNARTRDEELQNAIDRLLEDDLKEMLQAKRAGPHQDVFPTSLKDQSDADPLLLEEDIVDVGKSPVEAVDDDFLDTDIDLTFA